MSERLDHTTRLFDLQKLNELLHGFLMMFAPADEAADDTEIDWEDGEIEDESEGPAR